MNLHDCTMRIWNLQQIVGLLVAQIVTKEPYKACKWNSAKFLRFLTVFFLFSSLLGAADAEIKSHLLRTRGLKVLPVKPGVGQYKAIHATLTAKDFSYANFTFPVHSLALFPKPLSSFSSVSCGLKPVHVQARRID